MELISSFTKLAKELENSVNVLYRKLPISAQYMSSLNLAESYMLAGSYPSSSPAVFEHYCSSI